MIESLNLNQKTTLVARENIAKQSKNGQKEVWTAKKGDINI